MGLRKKGLIGGFILFLVLFSLTSVKAQEESYRLGFKTYRDVVWEYTYLNYTLIQLLVDENILSDSYLDKKVGDQEKFYIDEMEFNSNGDLGGIAHWRVFFYYYKGTNLQNGGGKQIEDRWYSNVAKDPTDAAPTWESGSNYFSNRFIPVNASNYLSELVTAIRNPSITSSGSSLIDTNIENVINYTKIYTYNENGIQEIRCRYYNSMLVYKFELVYYGAIQYLPSEIWSMVIIVLVITVILICIGILYKWLRKKTNEMEIQNSRNRKIDEY